MRVFEMTAHVQVIKRSAGRSATAAAAYRACCVLECEREGKTHDYARKTGLEASAIVLPAGAPAWASDRAKLWNAAELRERNGSRGKNAGAFKAAAITAREIMFGFPAELSAAGRLAVAHEAARHLADAHKVAADFSIHMPGKLGDQRNYHCHLLMTSRRMTVDGLGEKTREWDRFFTGSRTVTAFRAFLAAAMNAALVREGHAGAVHVEHRSYKTRGAGTVPTRHQGPGRTNARRVRASRERQTWERGERGRQADRHGQERVDLQSRQAAATAAKHGDIAERERRAVAAVRADVAAQHTADQAPKGLGRIFQVATGQAPRLEADRQARAAEREQVAERRIDALRAGFQAERGAFAASQAKDARALDERHRDEDRQMGQAAEARADRDRHAELQMRRDSGHDRLRDRQHDRKHEREAGQEPAHGPTP